MRPSRSGNRELLALITLFLVFVAAVAYYTHLGSEALPRTAPSSLNAMPPGAKALFLLYSRLGFHVDRLEADWSALSPADGLLILVEPLDPDRFPTRMELTSLLRWVEQGGSLLYIVTAPPRPLDAKDPLSGDVAVVPGSPEQQQVAPASANSPYTRDVGSILAECPVRLKPARGAPYQTLFQDANGAISVSKRVGKGNLIVIADDRLVSNATISEADNAIFAVNIASASVDTSGRSILFDEYHHGAGFTSIGGADHTAGLWSNVPLPLKLALLHLLGLSAVLIYNGNRRFGAAQALSTSVFRRSTDYLHSMARLLQRAGAADIAAQALYERFRRDLARQLDLPPDAPAAQMVEIAHRRYRIDAAALGTLIDRCEQIVRGERISEAELPALAQQIEQWSKILGTGR